MREKVAIYCKLSEEDKNKQNVTDNSGSIQNQKAMLCALPQKSSTARIFTQLIPRLTRAATNKKPNAPNKSSGRLEISSRPLCGKTNTVNKN